MEELDKETKECIYCFEKIDARATVCHHCLRSQNSWLVTLLKVLAVLVIIALLLGGFIK